MSLMNTETDYGSVSKTLHWLIAAMVIGLLTAGFTMTEMAESALRTQIYAVHKATGVLLLVLMVVRISWMFISPKPTIDPYDDALQHRLASLAHRSFYVLLLVMPISGLLFSSFAGRSTDVFGLFTISLPLAENEIWRDVFVWVHTITAWTLVTLLTVHIAAALLHHYYCKDRVLKRMLPGGK